MHDLDRVTLSEFIAKAAHKTKRASTVSTTVRLPRHIVESLL